MTPRNPLGRNTLKGNRTMEIRMLETVLGTFHNNPQGVKRGQVVEVEDWIGKRYIVAGKATAKVKGELPTPGQLIQEADALRAEVAREVKAKIPEEHRPVAGTVNIRRDGSRVMAGGA
jgi:hypothetical protein